MIEPQKPYHRWPSNENIDRIPQADRCLNCRTPRFHHDEEVAARANQPCPLPLTPVPGHFNPTTGLFCSREGLETPGGRCPDGHDHADHYSNDGHPECEDAAQ